MATRGILTVSAPQGQFNHRFIGSLQTEPEFQVPALGEWLAWCQRSKVPVSVDSFLSFAHQQDSGLIHSLTGVAPAFNPEARRKAMGYHYHEFLNLGAVTHFYHVEVSEGSFESLTVMERVLVRRSLREWKFTVRLSARSVWSEGATLARNAARREQRRGNVESAESFRLTAKGLDQYVLDSSDVK